MRSLSETGNNASRGIALLPVIIILLLIATLFGLGMIATGPIVKRTKTNDTKDIIEAATKAIISYAAANNKIPILDDSAADGTIDEFVEVVTNPNDAFTKPLIYVYDNDLTSVTTGGVCGRSTTFITAGGVSNVAFVILSGGDDFAVESNIGGTPVSSMSVSSSTTINIVNTDIYKIVTLEELKNKAGCYGARGGRLMILNNELPSGFYNTAYNATVFAAGGVPFSSGGNYRWCVEVNNRDTAPGGLSFNPNVVKFPNHSTSPSTCFGTAETSWGQANNLTISGTPTENGTFSLTFFARDNNDPAAVNDNIAQQTLNLKIGRFVAGGGGGGGAPQISFDQNMNNFVVATGTNGAIINADNTLSLGLNQNNTTGCVWFPDPTKDPVEPCDESNCPLSRQTMRAYFNFQFANADTSANSTTYADGFTFTVMPGDNSATSCQDTTICRSIDSSNGVDCSGCYGEYMGFCGIHGRPFAIEFDTYPNSTRNDPSGNYNHVAFVRETSYGGSRYGYNRHNESSNPACTTGASCTGNNPGCIFDSMCSKTYPVTWFEDAHAHNARIEIRTKCNGTCSTCENTGGGNNNALIKVWVDCTNCDDLTSNFTDSSPQLTRCFPLDSSLNNIKFGFTEATGASQQNVTISNFSARFDASALPSCTADGVEVRNRSTYQSTYYYKINGTGSCNSWPNSGSSRDIMLNDGETLYIYSNSSCTTQLCTTTFLQQTAYDTDGDCQTRTSNASTSTAICTFSDR